MIINFSAIALILLIVIIAIHYSRNSHNSNNTYKPTKHTPEPPEKEAGRRGERIATKEITRVLRHDDYLFTNVSVSYNGKPTELDNVIVNKYGVFIIEVKNYNGILVGYEDDFEWKKYKEDGYGNTFVKTVKNPIKQVKRQVYILAKFLQNYGVDVWVEGYAMLVDENSPVHSAYMLENPDDIDRAIHTPGRNRLDTKTIEEIKHLLRN